jgi:tRNA threonylcarbamoyladenosine biosynthesis protein TsaE
VGTRRRHRRLTTSSTCSADVELVDSRSTAETEAVGARVAERLAPGDVVVVSGEVGAGKTTLIRGACRALGVEEPVTSPTFTIGQRYGGGRLPVSHLDLYLGADGVAFVEWPAVGVERLGRPALEIRLEHASGDSRRLEIDW